MTEFRYRCSHCGASYRRNEVRYLCPTCEHLWKPGEPLCGVLTAEFDYETIRKKFSRSNARWDLFSAVESKYYPPYPVGNTPFTPAGGLGKAIGCRHLWLKNDGLNPSGSLKDRASFLVVAEAGRLRAPTVVTASTGNAASALAAVAASAHRRAVIFVPEKAPKAKLVQMLMFGAKVFPVRGTYDDAFRMSLAFTKLRGGLNRNTGYHPLTIEGKKTVGFEIFAQNGWKVPDTIFIPVGDGVILFGVYKAFYDLLQARVIKKMPRLFSVQANTSSAIHRYILSGVYRSAQKPDTIADSISVSVPSNAHLAREAVLATSGGTVIVTDREILEGQRLLAQSEGIFAEPAAAAVVAGVRKIAAAGALHPSEQVVLLITGHGLKDIDAPMRSLPVPRTIPADEDVLASLRIP
ncbi:MAG TPA: threonine synthase [Bacteroidota bacterium]|nr:threonine synthase [Bacteroidota bacterium]